jgi:PAS domain S-box-containing protein
MNQACPVIDKSLPPADAAGAGLFIDPGVEADRLRTILNAIPQMVWSTLPDGYHDFYNDRWYEFTGVRYGSTDGEGWNGMFHEDDQERAWRVWRHSLATGEPYEIEYRLRHRSGIYRWTLGRALPVRDRDGAIVRWFGTCTDIDELKQAEEARELIAHELSHRIKNLFAVIASIVSLSARDHPEAKTFAGIVRDRIAALAKANDYVRPHSPESAPHAGKTLHGLLDSLTAPYREGETARIIVSGDDSEIGLQAATSLSLVIHERATNAVKYGALALPGGTVSLRCERRGELFCLEWREQGGPPVEGPPAHQGFGSRMARQAAETQLGAEMTEDWDRGGLRLSLVIPQDALLR